MAKFVIFLVCLALIQASTALTCKKCADASCEKLEDDKCQAAPTKQKVGCLTEVYKDAQDKEVVNKKCVYFPDDKDKYGCVPVPKTTSIKCETCETDLCNSAPTMEAGYFAMMATAVVALFLNKFV